MIGKLNIKTSWRENKTILETCFFTLELADMAIKFPSLLPISVLNSIDLAMEFLPNTGIREVFEFEYNCSSFSATGHCWSSTITKQLDSSL